VRKRSAKRTTASKRAQLEDKLDDLVSLLRTQQATPSHNQSTDQQTTTPCSLDYSPQQPVSEAPHDDVLTDEDLSKIRQHHLPYFPFIYLPPDLTATQLVHTKPLLALAFKTISNKAYARQAKLSKSVRSKIAIQLIVDAEKSMDLLLGLLACMAW
jgi:hypothetical protein